MNIPILYDDEDLLVINKPSGVVVNRGNTVEGKTIQDWVEQEVKSEKWKVNNEHLLGENHSEFCSRSGIVHRIDKETSGCLIIAKSEKVFLELKKQFMERTVEKEYTALVHGKLEPKEGDINAPIDRKPRKPHQFAVVPGGKESYTKYRVISYYERDDNFFTFVSLFPKTGRTHQLRVHMKYLGYPLVSDYLYVGRKQQKKDRRWCTRVFLHASSITFTQPKTDERLTIESPLSEDLEEVLGRMEIT